MVEQLSPEDRAAAIDRLDEWDYDDSRDAISRQFLFADFSDHHPEWSNVWNRVDILLTTHDAGGLSARDVAMADAIEALT
jgi:4a-hydroxytetrahydrobiopterin dehydratase